MLNKLVFGWSQFTGSGFLCQDMWGFSKNVVDELNWYSAFVQVKRFADS